VLRLGSRNLLVLHLNIEGTTVAGTLDQPAKYSVTNSLFTNIRNGTRSYKIVRGRIADGALHFTTQNVNDKSDEDSYILTIEGDRAQLNYDDLPAGIILEPFSLSHASESAQVASDWEPNRTYTDSDSETPSPEMKAIFDEDQRVRLPGSAPADLESIFRSDVKRREETRKLLAAGALHTGKDYENAAFIFQHGDKPDDYLLAHTLAMIAVTKGTVSAIWIATATLDRYLQSIGQKQIYGTQYLWDAKAETKTPSTQDPYNRSLISDSVRRQLGVPGLPAQEKQLKAYAAQK
jgi:hypothetical protein